MPLVEVTTFKKTITAASCTSELNIGQLVSTFFSVVQYGINSDWVGWKKCKVILVISGNPRRLLTIVPFCCVTYPFLL